MRYVPELVWADLIKLPSGAQVLVNSIKPAPKGHTYIEYYSKGLKGNAVLKNDTLVEVMNE